MNSPLSAIDTLAIARLTVTKVVFEWTGAIFEANRQKRLTVTKVVFEYIKII